MATQHQLYIVNTDPRTPYTFTSAPGGQSLSRATVAELIGMRGTIPEIMHAPHGLAAWFAPEDDTAGMDANPLAAAVLAALGAHGDWLAALRGPVVITGQEMSHARGVTTEQSLHVLTLICATAANTPE